MKGIQMLFFFYFQNENLGKIMKHRFLVQSFWGNRRGKYIVREQISQISPLSLLIHPISTSYCSCHFILLILPPLSPPSFTVSNKHSQCVCVSVCVFRGVCVCTQTHTDTHRETPLNTHSLQNSSRLPTALYKMKAR